MFYCTFYFTCDRSLSLALVTRLSTRLLQLFLEAV